VEDSEDGLVVVLENYGRETAHLLAGVAYIQFLAVRCYTGQMMGVGGGGGGDPPRVCDYPGILGGAPPASTSAAAATTAAHGGGGGARALSKEEEEQEPGQMLISEIDDLVTERVSQA
jgi:hypothetical protein